MITQRVTAGTMSAVTITDIQITRDESAEGQRAAAGIWARATAKRDDLAGPAPIEEKLPGIQRRLSASTGFLHLARVRGDAAGFALTVTHGSVLELVYLGVAPEMWGLGVGGSLLAYVDDHARLIGADGLELWVIDDNERATRVYERSGWKRTEDLEIRGSAGRRERRLVKAL